MQSTIRASDYRRLLHYRFNSGLRVVVESIYAGAIGLTGEYDAAAAVMHQLFRLCDVGIDDEI